ncbi:hypothetical protein ACFZAD_24535 [Streptomyces iakyrus]|uniref:hypothetical protein n=1 Tax=Streptomyces iakyrus TaxID=68219 RepID=UPI0036E01CA3
MADQALLEEWYRIGKNTLAIGTAVDPPFTMDSFTQADTIKDLAEQITAYTWSRGTAFYFGDLCFINQVDGGDEWLTIRHGVAFESMTLKPIIERGEFRDLIGRLLAATKDECVRLEY